jgi:hypothetical protein
MTLQKQPNATIVYDNVEYNFFPYFNRVLTLLSEVFPSEELSDAQKIYLTVTSVSDAPPTQEIFELIVHELFPPKKKHTDDTKTMDFEQDAALIYAAFMQTYGIDLYAVRNQMDWRIFVALLKGIPENTELSRTIKIRGMKVPERTKDNSEYVDSIIKAKRAVALEEPIAVKKQRMAKMWLKVAEGLTNVRR